MASTPECTICCESSPSAKKRCHVISCDNIVCDTCHNKMPDKCPFCRTLFPLKQKPNSEDGMHMLTEFWSDHKRDMLIQMTYDTKPRTKYIIMREHAIEHCDDFPAFVCALLDNMDFVKLYFGLSHDDTKYIETDLKKYLHYEK